MVTTEIRLAEISDVQAIAENIRPEDKDEIWASVLQSPEEALLNGLEFSEEAYTGLVNGQPDACGE